MGRGWLVLGLCWLCALSFCGDPPKAEGPATEEGAKGSDASPGDGKSPEAPGSQERSVGQEPQSPEGAEPKVPKDAGAEPTPPERRREAQGSEPVPEPAPEPAAPEPAAPDKAAPTCGPIKTFATGKTPSKLLYVSARGSDASGDGSKAKPFASIRRALRGVQPGTAVRLLPGNYAPQSIENVQGTPQAPIWVGGDDPKQRPVFNGGSQGLYITKVRYVVFHDMIVRKSTSNGINCDDGGQYNNPTSTTHVLFRDLLIEDIGTGGNQDCLKLSGLRHFFVLHSTFRNCSSSGVDHVGCHHGLLAHNRFEGTKSNAVQCKGGSQDLEIRQNIMVNAGARAVNMGGSTGFQFFRPPLSKSSPNAEARDIRVVANLIQGGQTAFAFVGCAGCLAAHNTIVEPTRWIFRILQETNSKDGYAFVQSSNGKFINNIVYFKRGQISTYVNVGANTQPKTFEFSHNLWAAHDALSRSKPTLPAPEVMGIYGKLPGFVDGPGGKFQLKAQSPAVGAGKSLPQVPQDLRGACYKKPPSLGAYEVSP